MSNNVMRPLYKEVQNDALDKLNPDSHRGLWYDRFFTGYPQNWNVTEQANKENWATAKTAWIKQVTGPISDQHILNAETKRIEAANQRMAELCRTLGGQTRTYAANWHFATGMGNPHPVENGFLWHPTLGMPYIQGSAVKGLVRSWVESWAEFPTEHERLTTLYRWFGSEDKDPDQRKLVRNQGFNPPSQGENCDTEAGGFIFFDALPVAPVVLKADIMTPHMGKWYEQGGTIKSMDQFECIPADWHDPVPVMFLVADKPKFQFGIAPRTKATAAELDQVLDVLNCALEWLGAGAKTAAGYGVMNRDVSGDPVAPIHEEWPGVSLTYDKGKPEIWATRGIERAFSDTKEVAALLASLSEADAARLKKKGIKATIIVDSLGGKNWKITQIKPK